MSEPEELRVAGEGRLDHFLREALPHVSLRHLRRLTATGAIRVNGRTAHKGDRVRAGDTVRVPFELVTSTALREQLELEIPIVFEDDDLVALDKPCGVPSIAQAVDDTGTAANYLIARFPETRGLDPRGLEAGFVHRLDTATSGVLVAARTAAAHRSLRDQFRGGTALKTYAAVVGGAVRTAGTIRHSIRACPGDRSRVEIVTADTPHSRIAETRYRPVSTGDAASLLEVEIDSGARHQIRVHLAAIGHPIVGDPIYGTETGKRLLLHASSVVIEHPTKARSVRIQAPIPAAFARLPEASSGPSDPGHE